MDLLVSSHEKSLFALFLATSALAQSITNQTVDTGSGGRVGQNTALAVVAGNPAMVYRDAVKPHLLFARNTAADGSGIWLQYTVESGRAGDDGSLTTVGTQTGLAFYDSQNQNLEYTYFDLGTASISVEEPANHVLINNTASVFLSSVTITTSAPAKTFTVRNNGSATLTITGITTNTGNAADDADSDTDGITNHLEYAYGLNPTTASSIPASSFTINGGNIELTYTRGSESVNDVWFAVPWTETLDGLDWNYGDTTEQILSDNGTQQVIKATIPMGTNGRRFVRLEVW